MFPMLTFIYPTIVRIKLSSIYSIKLFAFFFYDNTSPKRAGCFFGHSYLCSQHLEQSLTKDL